MVNHKNKFIYIHIPRTAGTSIEVALESNKLKDHRAKKDYIKDIGANKWDEYFKFTFVRNPWDRIISMYSGQGQKKLFSEWAKTVNRQINLYKFPCQSDWITPDINFVGRFENIENDFKKVCNKIGITATLPHTNSSNHQHFSTYYTKEEIKVIYPLIQRDLLAFNYPISPHVSF